MTGFLRNCWYVAAWSHEVGTAPVGRKVIGDPLVLFRDGEGHIRVLEDRCPHRWLPLSMGRIVEGELQCRYHGLRFAPDGRCVHVPGSDVIPARTSVRSYPAEERDSWVWVWMGDPALANAAIIPPAFGIDNPRWTMRASQMEYAANYMLVNDNLCDLSHVDFVHDRTLGFVTDYGWSTSEASVLQRDRGVRIERWLRGRKASPKRPELVDTWSTYDFTAPGVFVMENRSFPHGAADTFGGGTPEGVPMTYRIEQQAVTPIDDARTLYFYATGFDAQNLPARLVEQIFEVTMATFDEDREVLEAQQRAWTDTPEGTPLAFIPQDRGPAMFRRVMNLLLTIERTPEG